MADSQDPSLDWRSILDNRISAKAWEIAKENLGSTSASPLDEADLQMTETCKALVCAYVVGTMSGLWQSPELRVALQEACADIDRRYPDGGDAKQFTIEDVYFAVSRVAPEIPDHVTVGLVGGGNSGFEKIVNTVTFELEPIGREITAELDRTVGRLSPSVAAGAAAGGGCLMTMVALAVAFGAIVTAALTWL